MEERSNKEQSQEDSKRAGYNGGKQIRPVEVNPSPAAIYFWIVNYVAGVNVSCFTDACCSFACGLGEFIGGSHNALSSARKALRKSVEKLRPQLPRERIRSIVIEELTHLVGREAELTGTKLEERLQVMAEAILALQERIDELSARGPISEADMWKAMMSLKAVEPLTDDERTILVNVFRQNIALQKPELVDVDVDESTS